MHRVIHAILSPPLTVDLGRAADGITVDSARELGRRCLQLLAVIVRGGFARSAPYRASPSFDVAFLPAVDDGVFLLVDHPFLGAPSMASVTSRKKEGEEKKNKKKKKTTGVNVMWGGGCRLWRPRIVSDIAGGDRRHTRCPAASRASIAGPVPLRATCSPPPTILTYQRARASPSRRSARYQRLPVCTTASSRAEQLLVRASALDQGFSVIDSATHLSALGDEGGRDLPSNACLRRRHFVRDELGFSST